MATTYNCEIRNFFGSSQVTRQPLARLGREGSVALSIDISSQDLFILSDSNVISYLEDLGYSSISNIDFNLLQRVLVNYVFEDGTVRRPSNYYTRTSIGGRSPLVDYYFSMPDRITITFEGLYGNQTLVSGQSHVINVSEEVKIRTINDAKSYFALLGFDTYPIADIPAPTIVCEAIDGSGTSSTVMLSSDFSESTVTNTVTETISSDQFDALETKVQANTDWIAAQPAFWEQVINSLNNNVNGALNSSAETRDLLVALQLSTIPNIESRLTALENE